MSRRGFMLASAAITMTGFLARLHYLQVAQLAAIGVCQTAINLMCASYRQRVEAV